MSRKNIILLLTIGILAILTLSVYAASTTLELTGKGTVEVGSTETMTLKLISDSDIIGVISGQVKGNENIESVQMQGKNGWQVTYNNGTGEFNVLKAEGAKTEDIAEITYKVKSEASRKANITVSNIKLTTIEYETTTASNVSKDVTIGSESTQPTATPTTTPTPDGGSESTPTPSTKPNNTGAPTTNPSQNSGVDKGDVSINNTDKGSSNGGTSSSGNQSSNKGPTTSSSSLPKAGAAEYLLISIIGLIISSIVIYVKYKNII